MNEPTSTLAIQAAVVSDRGLSDKRPLNEDSYLSDPARHIFAVADGVGGANAGEVASQTAMEVLDDAFRNHEAGADIEDLMELAIQRANASIHQMSREHPKLAAMATTVVALHLDGQIATIGHVGDSRLYRLTPDGKLHRDTADHSVVEEEVRAGRMTPEQAAHHPSRNVISRALGAEPSVEVDMKILEVQEGTAFLLCSDGITRHINDHEIREILSRYHDLEEACTEMKRRCYERGAEDNLTAVMVRVGDLPANLAEDDIGVAPTRRDLNELHDTLPGHAQESVASPTAQQQAAGLTPASRIAFPPTTSSDGLSPLAAASSPAQYTAAQPPPAARSSSGGIGRALLLLLLMAGIGAGAFFGGRYYAQRETPVATNTNANPAPVAPPPTPEQEFDKTRREVDLHPGDNAARMDKEVTGKQLETLTPDYLYLYGRALLLSNRPDDALRALKAAQDKLKDRPGRDSLKVETRMAVAVAALRTNNLPAIQTASKEFEEVVETVTKPAGEPTSNPSGPSGVTSTVK